MFAPATAQAQVSGAGVAAPALAGCDTDLIYLNQVTGWQQSWPIEWAALAEALPEAQAEALGRWKAVAGILARDKEAMRSGLAGGRTAPAPVVRRVLEQIDGLLEQPLAPSLKAPEWRALLDGKIRPAILDYATFLRDVYLPLASDKGLSDHPDGHRCFEQSTAYWTSLKLSPADIEALGRRLLARYRKQLSELTGLPDRHLAAYLADRRSDRGTASREEIVRVSEAAIARARAALPRWFDVREVPSLTVRSIPAQIEETVPAGYYELARDGAGATYHINLSRPGERRLMAEVIAFHEGIPGHHLALSAAPPAAINSGLVEGWAIYAEHLADEMGLYSTREDRIGMVAKHLWAASRLIVEPGLHVHGWPRDRAIAFMRDNTALSEREIAIEVDRYLAWPGHSLAYMVGLDAIERARSSQARCLGPRFDPRLFHAAILSPTMQSLEDVEALAARHCPSGETS
jgi:uncharacterized protein (DUF885 family)